MPKKTNATSVPLADAPIPEDITVFEAKEGEILTVETDVENISTPYTVIFSQKTLVYGTTDRREQVKLEKGTHRLSWSFTHVEKGWKHKLTAQIGGNKAVTLDDKSEAKKDKPYSIGLALVTVSGAQQ